MPYLNVFARRLIARLSGKEGICRRPSGFPQDFLCAEEHGESSSEYVKVVRQSVQEHERIGRDGVLRGSATGLAFGPAADGTADVGLRYDDVLSLIHISRQKVLIVLRTFYKSTEQVPLLFNKFQIQFINE